MILLDLFSNLILLDNMVLLGLLKNFVLLSLLCNNNMFVCAAAVSTIGLIF